MANNNEYIVDPLTGDIVQATDDQAEYYFDTVSGEYKRREEPKPVVEVEPAQYETATSSGASALVDVASLPPILSLNQIVEQTNQTNAANPKYEGGRVVPADLYDDYADKYLRSEIAREGLTKAEVDAEVAKWKAENPKPTYLSAAEPVPDKSVGDFFNDGLQDLKEGVISVAEMALLGADYLNNFVYEDYGKERRKTVAGIKESIQLDKSEKAQAQDRNSALAKKDGVKAVLGNAVENPAVILSTVLEAVPGLITIAGAAARKAILVERAFLLGASKEVAEQAAALLAKRVAISQVDDAAVVLARAAATAGQKAAVVEQLGVSALQGASGVSSSISLALDKAGITDPLERTQWQALALPAGAITGLLGKFSPLEASIFTNKLIAQKVPQGVIFDLLKHGSKEAIEEYLQTANESTWTNIGTKRLNPLDDGFIASATEGVWADAALGALTGGVMGAGMRGVQRVTGGVARDVPSSAPSSDPSAPSSDPSAPSSDPSAPSSDPSAPSSDPSAPSSDPSAPFGNGDISQAIKDIVAKVNAQDAPVEVPVAPPVEVPVVPPVEVPVAPPVEVPVAPPVEVPVVTSTTGAIQNEEVSTQSNAEAKIKTQSNAQGNEKSNDDGRQDGQEVGQVRQELRPLPTLPRELAKSSPRYLSRTLEFDNDLDKALYIARDSNKRSKADVDFIGFLESAFDGKLSEAEIRAKGEQVKALVAASVKSTPSQDKVIQVPRSPVASEYVNPRTTTPIDTTDAIVDAQPEVNDAPALKGLQDAIKTLPEAGPATAFVAAEIANIGKPKPRIRKATSDEANQSRASQPSPTRNTQGNNPRVEAVQPSVSGQPSGRRIRTKTSAGNSQSPTTGNSTSISNTSNSRSQGANTSSDSSAATVRKQVEQEPVQLNKPVQEKTLNEYVAILEAIDSPESKALAAKLSVALDEEFATDEGVLVSTADLYRARQLVSQYKQSKKLRSGPIDAATLDLHTDESTGAAYAATDIQKQATEAPLSAAAIAMLKSGNLRGALETTFAQGGNPLLRAIAGRFADVPLVGVNVKVLGMEQPPKDQGVNMGKYDPKIKTITLDAEYGMNEHALLHETSHAVTIHNIRNPTTPEHRAAIQSLTALMREASKKVGNDYAFTNLEEFVSESHSNPKFQEKLRGARELGRPSLWDRVVKYVAKLLGMGNLLDKVLNAADALISIPVPSDTSAVGLGKVPPKAAIDATPQEGKIRITIPKTTAFYRLLFDTQGSVLNLGKYIEKQLGALSVNVPDGYNIKLQSTLMRTYAEVALAKWDKLYWTPVIKGLTDVMAKYNKTEQELEEFFVTLRLFAISQEALADLDPTAADYVSLATTYDANTQAAEAYLEKLERTEPAFFKAALEVQKTLKLATDNTLDTQHAMQNNMSAKRLAALKVTGKSRYTPNGMYIPIQKDMVDGPNVTTLKQSFALNTDADKPFARVYAQAAMIASANEQNRLIQQLYFATKALDLVQVNERGSTKLSPLIDAGPLQTLKRNAKTGQIEEGQDSFLLDKDSIGVWFDDKYARIRINDVGLLNALKSTPATEHIAFVAAAIETVRWTTVMGATLKTGLNLAFPLKNTTRDLISVAAFLNPKIPYTAFISAYPPAVLSAFRNTFAGIFSEDAQTAKFKERAEAGAFISQRTFMGLADAAMEHSMKVAPTFGDKVKAAVKSPLDTGLFKVLLGFSQSLESATRMAVYDAAIASGFSSAQAAYEAKTTTVNFERRSAASKANVFYPFVNAALQGTRTFYDRTFGIDKTARSQQVLAGIFALGAIAAVIGLKSSGEDEDGINKYEKLPDYKADNNIIFSAKPSMNLAIPLPQEARLAYIAGNAFVLSSMGQQTVGESVGRIAKNTVAQMIMTGVGQADPFSTRGDLTQYMLRPLMPQLAMPVFDVTSKRDTFGRAFMQEDKYGNEFTQKDNTGKVMSEADKFNRNEPKLSRDLTEWLRDNNIRDVQPAILTNTYKSFGGASINNMVQMFDPKAPMFEGQQTNPMLKAFVAEVSPMENKTRVGDALAALNVIMAKPNPTAKDKEMYAFLVANKKEAVALWKGYKNMTDAQVTKAALDANKLNLAALRKYYIYTGRVKG